MPSRNVCVLVMGDLGRSPRMQYHTRSLISQDTHTMVHLVGYHESPLIPDLLHSPNLHVYNLPQFNIGKSNRWIRTLLLPIKAIFLLVGVLFTLLWKIKKMDVILVQNPPSIPTLFAAKIAALVHCAKFVIDWHNYGYSILELSIGKKSLLVWVSKWYEKVFGRFADAHFCVTQAMQVDLLNNWGINAVVLYDKPPEFFKKSTLLEFHSLFSKLQNGRIFSLIDDFISMNDFFTSQKDLKTNRPALIVSSTSYTEDEDFNILLEALCSFDLYLDKASFKVLVIITGKGPLYEHFRLKIHDQNQKMSHIRILQAWLDPEDYPVLLGSSDLGISLHLSSSGRDLPMKIVDMFGAGLPVCAFSFPCLSELVQDQVNGLLFSNSNELSQNLIKIFDKSEAHSEKLKKLYEGVRDCSTYKMRWSENWNQVALPVLLN